MSAPHSSPEDPTAYRAPEETPTVIADGSRGGVLQLTPGTVIGERYRVVSLIGSGGMGQVYRADDLKLGQAVALKFLARHGDAKRLYEEVRVGRQVSHPNVCRLYDIAEVDGHLFITMEFVDGEDLASLLRRVGRLSVEKALAVTRDMCAGVAAAHEKGVMHRDLKPANVMIDGRGRARVTDFGLAVAGEIATDGAGTPAYMAPEQLAGEPASMRSDIYALGLVIYELFTGRRAFEATSTYELLDRQRRGEFTRPSLVTKEVPAAVERVIARCLDPDPEARPSVEQIALELPGGDPLAAAIAAGETPSPAMVAAAAKSGDLPATAAWPVFLVAIAGIVGAGVVSQRTLLRSAGDMKPPEVLREKARDVLALAGVREKPADSDIFVKTEATEERLVAVYRQSPRSMRPFNANGTLLTYDPPLDASRGARIPGMANVEMDGSGRLLRMIVVPPSFEPPPQPSAIDWTAFLAAAGYDVRNLTRTDPHWAARVDSDEKAAWLSKDGNRIEAAAYHNRPVSFEVMRKGPAGSSGAVTSNPIERVAYAMFVAFMIAIPTAGILLARANLRKRQGDRQGALRTAGFFLVMMFVSFVFRAHHPLGFVDEWIITSWHVAQATYWALMTALIYLALEPFVRRRWPQILISWTRLLAGRYDDPMVGRDTLMGAAFAAVAVVTWHVTLLISGASFFFTAPQTFGPSRFVVAAVAGAVVEAMLRGVGLVILIVVLRAAVRHDIVASLLTIALIGTMTLGDTFGPLWLRAYYAGTAAIGAVILARQLGLLAVMSYAFFVTVLQRVPLTFDSEAWYFARSLGVMILLAAIVGYAFRLALGGKRWLPVQFITSA